LSAIAILMPFRRAFYPKDPRLLDGISGSMRLVPYTNWFVRDLTIAAPVRIGVRPDKRRARLEWRIGMAMVFVDKLPVHRLSSLPDHSSVAARFPPHGLPAR
jgi:hypothetical protein